MMLLSLAVHVISVMETKPATIAAEAVEGELCVPWGCSPFPWLPGHGG